MKCLGQGIKGNFCEKVELVPTSNHLVPISEGPWSSYLAAEMLPISVQACCRSQTNMVSIPLVCDRSHQVLMVP